MPVIAHLASGETKTYAQADAATKDDGRIAVQRWNTEARRFEELDALDSQLVTSVEVVKHGVVQQIVSGAGGRSPI